VVDTTGQLVGVLNGPKKEYPNLQKSVPVVYKKNTLRQAMDHMLNHEVKYLCVLDKKKPHLYRGVVSLKDIQEYEIQERKKMTKVASVEIFSMFRRCNKNETVTP
jgi:CBS-domain-containing membrane protein